MPLDLLFELGSSAALVAWLMLGVAAVIRHRSPQRILLFVGGRLAPILLSITYVVLLVAFWRSAPGGSFGSLDGVAQLFSSRGKLLGGWLHFLAFDLLVGRWIIDRVLESGQSRWVLLPCLPFTFMYGPLGFILYCLVHSWSIRRTNAAVLP